MSRAQTAGEAVPPAAGARRPEVSKIVLYGDLAKPVHTAMLLSCVERPPNGRRRNGRPARASAGEVSIFLRLEGRGGCGEVLYLTTWWQYLVFVKNKHASFLFLTGLLRLQTSISLELGYVGKGRGRIRQGRRGTLLLLLCN